MKERVHKDIVIIGAGMAGLTAALYCGRMNLDTLVLENGIIGGQIANATAIENYPGFESVSGGDLIATVQKQAENFGAVIDEFDEIESVTLKTNPKIIETQEKIYSADAVIIASGMNRRKLPLPEEKKFAGHGVIYLLLNTINGKPYVGQTWQTFKRRIIEHKRNSKKAKFGVDAAICKYGWENFTAEIVEVCPVEQLNEREIFWIKKLNSKVPNGYNLTDGGKGIVGCTEETRAILSAKHKGIKKSSEHRFNLSFPHRKGSPFKNLLNEMDKHHITYFLLAELLGLKPATFSNKMRGRYHFTMRQIDKLVEFFGLPAEYLMARDDGLSATTSKQEGFAKISAKRRGYSPYKNLLIEIDKRHLTYRGLSKLTGISKSALPLKISGKVKFTAKEKLKLVEIFNKPIEYLLFKEEL